MEHLTEKYGQACNQIVCTNAEFGILKSAFEQHGVRVRAVLISGDKVEFQIINPYKDYCLDNLTGKMIKKLAKDEIKIDC